MIITKDSAIIDRLKQAKTDSTIQIGAFLDGGGIKAAISAGNIAVLEILGLTKSIKAWGGTSAGAFNAAFAIANQCLNGLTMYTRYLLDKKFFNPFRISGQMDLSYVINVIKNTFNDVSVCPSINFYVTATKKPSFTGTLVNAKNHKDQFLELLTASANLVEVTKKPWIIRGLGELYDGGYTLPLPIKEFIDLNGALTDVIVFLNNPFDQKRRAYNLIGKTLLKWRLRSHPNQLKYLAKNRLKTYNQALSWLHIHDSYKGTNIWILAPEGNELSFSTKNKAQIKKVIINNAVKCTDLFSLPKDKALEVIDKINETIN